jgi:hypothetical protein
MIRVKEGIFEPDVARVPLRAANPCNFPWSQTAKSSREIAMVVGNNIDLAVSREYFSDRFRASYISSTAGKPRRRFINNVPDNLSSLLQMEEFAGIQSRLHAYESLIS